VVTAVAASVCWAVVVIGGLPSWLPLICCAVGRSGRSARGPSRPGCHRRGMGVAVEHFFRRTYHRAPRRAEHLLASFGPEKVRKSSLGADEQRPMATSSARCNRQLRTGRTSNSRAFHLVGTE